MTPFTRRRLLAATACGGLLAVTGRPARAGSAPAALAEAMNRLGLATLAEQAQAAPGETRLVSPLGLGGTLAVLAQGAGGATAARLLPALDAAPDGAAALADAWAALAERLPSAGHRASPLAWSAGLWHAPELAVGPAAAARVRDRLGGAVAALDFAAGQGAATVNAWAKEKTHGMIPAVLDRMPAETDLVVAGAMAFKAGWATAFDPAETRPRPFVRADGRTVEVPMMARVDPAFRHCREDRGEAVLLPYAGGDFALAVAVPVRGTAPAALLAAGGGRPAWLDPAGYRRRPGRLALPKLERAVRADLLDDAANPTVAALLGGPLDLGGFGGAWAGARRSMDQAVHAVALRWDETGTEAAAVTALSVARGLDAGPDAPFDLTVDRPFAAGLLHVPTGLVLLAGVIGSPVE